MVFGCFDAGIGGRPGFTAGALRILASARRKLLFHRLPFVSSKRRRGGHSVWSGTLELLLSMAGATPSAPLLLPPRFAICSRRP